MDVKTYELYKRRFRNKLTQRSSPPQDATKASAFSITEKDRAYTNRCVYKQIHISHFTVLNATAEKIRTLLFRTVGIAQSV